MSRPTPPLTRPGAREGRARPVRLMHWPVPAASASPVPRGACSSVPRWRPGPPGSGAALPPAPGSSPAPPNCDARLTVARGSASGSFRGQLHTRRPASDHQHAARPGDAVMMTAVGVSGFGDGAPDERARAPGGRRRWRSRARRTTSCARWRGPAGGVPVRCAPPCPHDTAADQQRVVRNEGGVGPPGVDARPQRGDAVEDHLCDQRVRAKGTHARWRTPLPEQLRLRGGLERRVSGPRMREGHCEAARVTPAATATRENRTGAVAAPRDAASA